ncbi:GNAT family N-acetyltransferase [Kibdelosporangium lantanae]
MGDFEVRVLEESELRQAITTFRVAMHSGAPTDEEWAEFEGRLTADRYFGAVADGEIVGSAGSFPSSIMVPGGNVVPQAAVSRVGVRADHTRRGIVTELMRAQLTDARARGEVLATLHATEAVIYGRFGYGIAIYGRELVIRGAKVRADVPRAGHVRSVSNERAKELLPDLYQRIGLYRPGMMTRSEDWWPVMLRHLKPFGAYHVAIHSGPDGDDGFVAYRVEPVPGRHGSDRLVVADLHAATAAVRNDLWRYVLGIDLVEEVYVDFRPTDELPELLLEDPRKVRTAEYGDELWVRVVDVPKALAARTYGAGQPVVIQVEDAFLPENSGTYEVAPQGAVRVNGEPGLVMDAESLAMIYYGSVRPSALAAAGRLQVNDPVALERADRLFVVEQTAWCGTFF